MTAATLTSMGWARKSTRPKDANPPTSRAAASHCGDSARQYGESSAKIWMTHGLPPGRPAADSTKRLKAVASSVCVAEGMCGGGRGACQKSRQVACCCSR